MMIPVRNRTEVADIVRAIAEGPLPVRVTAYDGSSIGPQDSAIRLHVATPKGLRYLVTSPGDLGLARAYVAGDLQMRGAHPGDPYPALMELRRGLHLRHPGPVEAARLAAGLGPAALVPPPAPAQEAPPRWRRAIVERTPLRRSAAAIAHHYDVSNAFYELLLGPSMAYTCAVYDDPADSLETAQERKFELVCAKLGLRSGMRLLDVGCGWGSMVRYAARHHGVTALGVTLSREQAEWARRAIERDGLGDRAEVRHLDYRELPPDRFDAISSIGLTEHIGVRNYPAYFAFLTERLVPGGRLLNHCITRPDGHVGHRPDAFTDRYVFPDGELAAPGRIVGEIHDAGLEVQHVENLRLHYGYTLTAWCANLRDNWDACVAEVGEQTARVWGLYLAGSRISFEVNRLQLHQVLASRPLESGASTFPLRPDWEP